MTLLIGYMSRGRILKASFQWRLMDPPTVLIWWPSLFLLLLYRSLSSSCACVMSMTSLTNDFLRCTHLLLSFSYDRDPYTVHFLYYREPHLNLLKHFNMLNGAWLHLILLYYHLIWSVYMIWYSSEDMCALQQNKKMYKWIQRERLAVLDRLRLVLTH